MRFDKVFFQRITAHQVKTEALVKSFDDLPPYLAGSVYDVIDHEFRGELHNILGEQNIRRRLNIDIKNFLYAVAKLEAGGLSHGEAVRSAQMLFTDDEDDVSVPKVPGQEDEAEDEGEAAGRPVHAHKKVGEES